MVATPALCLAGRKARDSQFCLCGSATEMAAVMEWTAFWCRLASRPLSAWETSRTSSLGLASSAGYTASGPCTERYPDNLRARRLEVQAPARLRVRLIRLLDGPTTIILTPAAGPGNGLRGKHHFAVTVQSRPTARAFVG